MSCKNSPSCVIGGWLLGGLTASMCSFIHDMLFYTQCVLYIVPDISFRDVIQDYNSGLTAVSHLVTINRAFSTVVEITFRLWALCIYMKAVCSLFFVSQSGCCSLPPIQPLSSSRLGEQRKAKLLTTSSSPCKSSPSNESSLIRALRDPLHENPEWVGSCGFPAFEITMALNDRPLECLGDK